MSYFASVGGLQVVAGSIMIQMVGPWTADLSLATPLPVAGTLPVVLGNLSLVGTVYRSTQYGGQTRVRMVGGYGGWRSTIGAQGYGGGGVSLFHVLGDAAAACGEKMGPVAGLVGSAFSRLDGPASDVLWQCVAQGLIPTWRIDQLGLTQVSAWPTTVVGTSFTVTDQKPDEGLVEIGTEDYASWLPGCTFSNPLIVGSFTAAGVTFNFDNEGQARVEVLTGTTDRLLGPLRSFVDSRVAPTRYYGRYAYEITAVTTATFSGLPVDSSKGLPDIVNEPLRSDSIASYLPVEGGQAHIQFVDGDADQPVCVWTSGPPVTVSIGTLPEPLAFGIPTVAGFTAMAAAATTLAGLSASPGPWNAGLASGAVTAAFTALAAGGTSGAALGPTTTVKAGP